MSRNQRDRPLLAHVKHLWAQAKHQDVPAPHVEVPAKSGWRRRYLPIYAPLGLAGLTLLILLAPTLAGQMNLSKRFLRSIAARRGLTADAQAVQVGWWTPLQISGLTIKSESAANHLHIGQIDSNMRLLDLLWPSSVSIDDLRVRDVDVRCSVGADGWSLEDEFQKLLTGQAAKQAARIEIRNVEVAIISQATGQAWRVSELNAAFDLQSQTAEATFSGSFAGPAGKPGAAQGKLIADLSSAGQTQSSWRLEAHSQEIPLSFFSLVRESMPELLPRPDLQLDGRASGSIHLTGDAHGQFNADFTDLEVAGLQLRDTDEQILVWENQRALVRGGLQLSEQKTIGRNLEVELDFATATLNGALPLSLSTPTQIQTSPTQWIAGFEGTASAVVNLESLQKALPGFLKFSLPGHIDSGNITASIAADGSSSRQLSLESDTIYARLSGRTITLEPIQITAAVTGQGHGLQAKQVQCVSSFATLSGQGDLGSGSAEFEIQSGTLAEILWPGSGLRGTRWDGPIQGSLGWDVDRDDAWRVTASAAAAQSWPAQSSRAGIQPHELRANLEASGRRKGLTLEELTDASLVLLGHNLDLRAELQTAVEQPNSLAQYPIKILGSGDVSSLAGILADYLPSEVHEVQGQFELHLDGNVSATASSLTGAGIEVTQPGFAYRHHRFSQPSLTVDFDGNWDWPSGDLKADALTAVADAISLQIRGQAGKENTNLEVAWQAQLERARRTLQQPSADLSGASHWRQRFLPVSFQSVSTPEIDDWFIEGDLEGKLTILGDGPLLDVATDLSIKNLILKERHLAVKDSSQGKLVFKQSASPTWFNPRWQAKELTATADAPPAPKPETRVIWTDPHLRLHGTVQYDTTSHRAQTDAIEFNSGWLATTLAGRAHWHNDDAELELSGPASLKMRPIGEQLARLANAPIQFTGVHQGPLHVHLQRTRDSSVSITASGQIGWDSAEVVGAKLGPANIPIQLSEQGMKIIASKVPMGEGYLSLAGDISYGSGPPMLTLHPGFLVHSVALTQDITHGWIERIAPPKTEVTSFEGKFGVEIDTASIDLQSPALSKATGRITMANARAELSPAARHKLNSARRLRVASQEREAAVSPEPIEFISLPNQSVEFDLEYGIVKNQGIALQLGDMHVVNRGQITLDGRLNMMATIPVDAVGTPSRSPSTASHFMHVPVLGTIFQPVVDPAGLGSIAALLTSTPMRDAAKLLEEQAKRTTAVLQELNANPSR